MSSKRFFTKWWSVEYTTRPSFAFSLVYQNRSYDDDTQISLAFFWKLWITFNGHNGREEPKKYGIEINHLYISIYYGLCDYHEEMKDKKLIRFWWSSIPDFFFWREIRFRSDEKYHWVYELKMDRWDSYNVAINSHQLYWWRPRWFGRKYWKWFNLKPDRGIPCQWKWENSWDCGNNATYEMSCSAQSPEEALQILKDSCEKDRKKYWEVKDITMLPINNDICSTK